MKFILIIWLSISVLAIKGIGNDQLSNGPSDKETNNEKKTKKHFDIRNIKFKSFRNKFYRGRNELNKARNSKSIQKSTFLICKKSFLPNKRDQCEKLSKFDAENIMKLNSKSVNEFFTNSLSNQIITNASLILNMNSNLVKSFVCFYFKEEVGNKIENDSKICSKINKLCNEMEEKEISKNKDKFIEMLKEYSSNQCKKRTVSPIYRILIFHLPKEFLELAYYYLDKSAIDNTISELTNFDIIFFETENANRYLYRINGVKNYQIKLKLQTHRPKDKIFRLNFDYSHEKNLFRKNSLLSNFKHLKNKFKQCIEYKLIYIFYLKKLRKFREFLIYYQPIIEVDIDSDYLPGLVTLNFEEFYIKFKSKSYSKIKRIKGNVSPRKGNSIYEKDEERSLNEYINHIKDSFSGKQFRFSQVPETIFYNNRRDFPNEETYLEQTINEKIKSKRKSNNYVLTNSVIDLYNNNPEGGKEDIDFINLNQQ